MIRPSYFLDKVLEADLSKDALFRLGAPESVEEVQGDVLFAAPLLRQVPRPEPNRFDDGEPGGRVHVRVRLYGEQVVRMMISLKPREMTDESPMLEWDESLRAIRCSVAETEGGWALSDGAKVRVRIPRGAFSPEVLPDGEAGVRFQGDDRFFASLWDSLSAFALKRADGSVTTGVSLEIAPGERFCGTGERFAAPDLFGRRIDLVNDDALGVNNDRAYKNIPFLLSSRPYGLFMHSTAKQRLDIGAQSTRALQWLVEDDALDIFFIGGGSLERILLNYRKITGFPRKVPLWSFGAWMSRMTYTSDEQVSAVAERLRREEYPMDVLHLDTGWFEEDWKCDWRFSKKRFPDPAGFFRRMRESGFRVSLWQYPYVRRECELSAEALEKGYVGKPAEGGVPVGYGDAIDFTNPGAAAWYKGLLRPLLETGAAAIKADFGENVDESAAYRGVAGEKYRNLYSLLYQKAVWEVTEEVKGREEAVIWARSGWAGSQRYPVHWGGDSACTFDGLAGSIRGGLHLGLSGFAFWSHDVPGFYGVPDFMKSRPSDVLYVRWTQAGTFTSHMRYHGTTPREPWEYPAAAEVARQWLRLRYSLLPYIVSEAEKCCRSGLPMLRSLVIEWTDDPAVWGVSDEYMFGDAFLVCPVLRAGGVRDVYLPEGRWVDFWSGEVTSGPARLKEVRSPLSRIPLYVRYSAEIKFAEPVQCTDRLADARTFTIIFDEGYPGFDGCELKEMIDI